MVLPIMVNAIETAPNGWEKGIKRIGNHRKNRGYSIVEINQNTEKIPGDQTSDRTHQLILL